MNEEEHGIISFNHLLGHYRNKGVKMSHISADLESLVGFMVQKNLEVIELDIADHLQKQLFRDEPLEDEVCHLTYDMWKDLKQSILSGEYRGEYLPSKE